MVLKLRADGAGVAIFAQTIDDDQLLFLQKPEIQDIDPFITGKQPIQLDIDQVRSKDAIDEFVYRLSVLHLRKTNLSVLTVRKLATDKLLTRYYDSYKDDDPYKSYDDIDFLAKLLYQIVKNAANDISALSDEQIKLIDKTKRTFEDKSDSLPRSHISFSKLKNVSLVADTFFHRPSFLSRRKETFYPCFFYQSKIDLPADKNFLMRFVNLYGSSPDRALTEREVNSCINFCYNYRNSYIIELFGDCDMIFKTIVHSISPNTCVHMTIMAESSNICKRLTRPRT